MRVQRVVMPESGRESWTLLGDDLVPVQPVERFLAYLASIEKSPNTVKAYAHDLKDWWAYLAGHGVGWQSVTVPPGESTRVTVPTDARLWRKWDTESGGWDRLSGAGEVLVARGLGDIRATLPR